MVGSREIGLKLEGFFVQGFYTRIHTYILHKSWKMLAICYLEKSMHQVGSFAKSLLGKVTLCLLQISILTIQINSERIKFVRIQFLDYRQPHKGPFKNYVDKILTIFDYLPTSTWTFFTLNVDKKKHFLTTYPPHLVHVVFERPHMTLCKIFWIFWFKVWLLAKIML